MKKIVAIFALLIALLFNIVGCTTEEKNEETRIVTSFYPMYIIALNLTEGAENVSLENMADVNVGCLHDYTLKTSDLIKLEKADIFIINGLRIESFIDKVLNSNSKLNIIDASKNITNIIKDEKETNAHVWLDIDNYILQVTEVAEKLKEYNPKNSAVYENNKQKYIESLNQLKNELPKENEQKAISFSESLAYLKNTMNLEILTIETDHEQSSLSAEKLKQVVEYAKNKDITKILVDNISSTKNADTLASEIGGKVYVLNSFLSGKMEKDSYQNIMKENFKLMEE